MAPQQQVTNEEFLERLSRLFESSSKAHSVFVSHKKISKDASLTEPTIVVRATDGRGGSSSSSNRTKLTTHVQASKLNAFQDQYSAILRASTAAFLRKRDKAKERRVDKLLKEKRKRMEEVLHSLPTTNINTKSKQVETANGDLKATNASGTAGGVKGSTPNMLKVTSIGAKRGAGRRKRQQAQHKAKQLRREQKRIAATTTAAQASTQKVG